MAHTNHATGTAATDTHFARYARIVGVPLVLGAALGYAWPAHAAPEPAPSTARPMKRTETRCGCAEASASMAARSSCPKATTPTVG